MFVTTFTLLFLRGSADTQPWQKSRDNHSVFFLFLCPLHGLSNLGSEMTHYDVGGVQPEESEDMGSAFNLSQPRFCDLGCLLSIFSSKC